MKIKTVKMLVLDVGECAVKEMSMFLLSRMPLERALQKASKRFSRGELSLLYARTTDVHDLVKDLQRR